MKLKLIDKLKRHVRAKSIYEFTVIVLIISIVVVTFNLILAISTQDKGCTLTSHIEEKCSKHSALDIMYPELYIENPEKSDFVDKDIVYLTFDDGPSERTVEILDILEKHDVKATFFVTVQEEKSFTEDIMKQIVQKGHSIGVHTYSHDYKDIYSSVERYLDDFSKIYNYIYKVTGVKSQIFRFPGGSKNSYNKKTYKAIVKEMGLRGFVYYDWNISSDDSIGKYSAQTLYEKSIKGIDEFSRIFLLYHDSRDRKTTVKALDLTIEKLKKEGFKFDKITRKVKPVVMGGSRT